MNNSIATYYINAELALAAYANWFPGIQTDEYIRRLQAEGMGGAQAAQFVQQYRVVDQYNESHTVDITDPITGLVTGQGIESNGLSVTLYQQVGTGKLAVAIRGTNDVIPDLVTGIKDIVLTGSFQTQAQYLSLKAKIQEWLGTGELSSGFSVTGHSLGGFLAVGLTADFGADIDHTYLYNTPGIGGIAANLGAESALLDALQIKASLDKSKISNLRADAGISPVAGLGTPVVDPVSIHIEDQTSLSVSPSELPALNHSQATLTESLAVYDLFARIYPAISLNDISTILKATSNVEGGTLEQTVNPLLKLFNQTPLLAMINATRDKLYEAIIDLQGVLPQPGATSPYKLVSLADLNKSNTSSVVNAALDKSPDALAYRYALKEMNPFVVTGADYSQFDQNGSLDLFNPATGNGELTQKYLTDRAQFLVQKISFNISDGARVPRGTTLYQDLASGLELRPTVIQQKYIFGGDGNDAPQFSAGDDHIYGGFGDDLIAGGASNDTLDGGEGNDQLQGGEGDDTLAIKAYLSLRYTVISKIVNQEARE